MRLKKYAFILLLLFFSHHNLLAQTNSSGIKLFFEKVYLHVDRTYYASGDDIWFKAYLVNAQSNYPVNTSNNLYVELINPINKIVSREVVRLDNGIGAGDFKLDDSIAGGAYRIRAYTNWMRNFGNHFVFEKEIQVKNIPGVNKRNAIVDKVTALNKKAVSPSGYKIQFFPEGGSMVEGLSSIVAFKVEDANGNGIEASGSVISSKGETVAHFATSHLGMGSFNFKPEAGLQYKASVQYEHGGSLQADFPRATPDGFVLKVTDADASNLLLNIYSNASTLAMHPTGEITIAVKHAGKICYSSKMILKDGTASGTIDKKDFPAGIASITLYDENLLPYCERLVYVEDNNPLMVNLTTDKSTYQPREKVTVNISVTDAHQVPVKANLSMAVDDEIEKQSPENILSYLMLQSEVNGKIENASEYFNDKNPLRHQQLDLLLSAQGWRNFVWRQMADTTIRISYLPEPGITISGKVTQGLIGRPAANMNITLLAPQAKGNKIFITKTNEQGRYYLDGLPLYGTQAIKINSKNDKDKKGGELFIDTLFNNVLPVDPVYFHPTDTSVKFRQFAEEAAKRMSSSQNTKWYNILPEVVVNSKKNNTVVLRDGQGYMNFGYPEYNFKITPDDYKQKTIEDFLVQKIPGAGYDVEHEGINFISNGKPVRPRFIVDKREDGFERVDYYRIPLTQVISIVVRHMVGMNLTDVFLIYLELKPGAFNTDPSFINTDITGYYEARSFYSPNYQYPEKAKPDERTTIHWAPIITTDENGKASVSFYNADPKSKIRLDVQGVTDKGVPVVAGTNYEVK